ncbi:MAG: hypothetical protein AMXMBFR47_30910 [Planctomycetota bacterium]
MDATGLSAPAPSFSFRTTRLLALGAAIAGLTGCQGMFAAPGASRSEPPPRDEEPVVVRAQSQPASRPAEDVDAALAEKIEDWAMRVQRADARRGRGEPDYAADAQPAAPDRSRPLPRALDPRGTDAPKRPDPREIKVEFSPDRPATTAAPPGAGGDSAKAPASPPVLKNVWTAPPVSRAGSDSAGQPGSRVGLNETATAAASTPTQLSDVLDDILASPGESGFREQMDRRIAAVLLGDYAKARQPLDLVSDEQNQLGQRLVETLIAIRDQSGGDPAGESTDALRKISELRHSLRSVSDLGLATVAICRAVRGFGQYEAFEPAQFTAGRANEFVLYCELRDFASAEQPDGSFESRFSLKVAILSHSGDEVSTLAADDIVDRCKARRNDCFLSPVIRLPATLSPGEYSARVTVEDKIKKRVVERVATFRVVSKG